MDLDSRWVQKKKLVNVFIDASVSELKIHSALVAGRYRKLLRQMGVYRSTGFMCSH